MRGDRSWFIVEFKSFEILIDETRGKRRGKILLRNKCFFLWFRFWSMNGLGPVFSPLEVTPAPILSSKPFSITVCLTISRQMDA
uniref:Uncharacterized protein n=1 Tax=Vitis vinifera TaxID=29760 RepID=F6HK13_VITVI